MSRINNSSVPAPEPQKSLRQEKQNAPSAYKAIKFPSIPQKAEKDLKERKITVIEANGESKVHAVFQKKVKA